MAAHKIDTLVASYQSLMFGVGTGQIHPVYSFMTADIATDLDM